jgi:filamentous hemagglutinin
VLQSEAASGTTTVGNVVTKSADWKSDPYHPNWKNEPGPKSVGADVTKGVIKASETIGRPVEAVIGNKKRLLRVDIEPNGKLQIQSGSGKESIVDFRPDLSKPLAPQINKAFKRLPKSSRDQLIKNAEKGLKRLQETGNM